MINPQLIQEIQTITQEFWNAEVQMPEFVSLATGKEIGHRIADRVDEQTTNLLRGKYDVRFEHGPKGQRARSMGDFWLRDNGIFHPVNVKAGQENSNGQPNVVSLKKLLEKLLNRQIDSYYLIIVKFRLTDPYAAIVYVVDILDYIDCITFDSGPGQVMLKESQFYKAVSSAAPNAMLTIKEKIGKLFALLEDGEKRLVQNRAKDLLKYRELYALYNEKNEIAIEQQGINLQGR